MTTVYSPAAILIITLAVLLAVVILLTLLSFCCYVATGRPLIRLGRDRREHPALFALQEMWRQSYWWVNANWIEIADMTQKGAVKPVEQFAPAGSIDFLDWLRRTAAPRATAFVTISQEKRHFAASFAVKTDAGLVELSGVEAAGYTLPLLQRSLSGTDCCDIKTVVAALDAASLSPVIAVPELMADARHRFIARLAQRLRR